MVDDWMLLFGGVLPLTVEVLTDQGASCIAKDHTVWVHHRYNLKDKVVSEYPRLNTRSNQIVNNALHHVRGASLSRVHSRTENNRFLLFHLLLSVCKSCHG
jgi:hypothetical protein